MTAKNRSSLDAIAEAKAKLAEELQRLEQQETELRQQQATDAFDQVVALLQGFGSHFSLKQKNEIFALIGSDKPKTKNPNAGKEVAPKYWLPHTRETWTGRGRPPKAFTAWEGTAAYKEWKARHPDEKFPKYPG